MLEDIWKQKQIRNFECPVITADGKQINILWNSSLLTVNENKDRQYVLIGTDIEERKRYEEKIKYLAFYDSLTGLPNREMFENEVNKHLINKLKNIGFTIAYIDIDNFKNINDSMGHQVGDIFLKYFSECLKAEVAAL
jgi:PleD family two-component response regulator